MSCSNAELARAILAKHIIAAAKEGEYDQGRLRDGALITRRNQICISRGLVFGPVGVHNARNGLVDHVEDEGAG
jgi:hypothetical protein